MSYRPSPRPTYNGPAAIPYQQVTRHLWGDDVSGRVADWIYISSARIHQLVFGLPPGGAFRHSDGFRTVFAADELLYVLEGTMIIANPEIGEVHRVQRGEGLFFRRDTWHHCFNHGDRPLRVLEFFAPPPSQGTSGAYAQTRPNLTDPHYAPDSWLGRWPEAADEARRAFSMKVIRETDLLWQLDGAQQQTLTGIFISTEHITVGRSELPPGSRSDVELHGGDEGLYVLQGALQVHLPEHDGACWFELNPGDGFYMPQGVAHQYYNMGHENVQFMFAVAPQYAAQ